MERLLVLSYEFVGESRRNSHMNLCGSVEGAMPLSHVNLEKIFGKSHIEISENFFIKLQSHHELAHNKRR